MSNNCSEINYSLWNFVKEDYTGFNIKQSIERSIQWKSVVEKNKTLSSRIGTSSFWLKTLEDFNIFPSSKPILK